MEFCNNKKGFDSSSLTEQMHKKYIPQKSGVGEGADYPLHTPLNCVSNVDSSVSMCKGYVGVWLTSALS